MRERLSLLSFCNASPRGLVLGLYGFDSGHFRWLDALDERVHASGATGLVVRESCVHVLFTTRAGACGLACLDQDLRFVRAAFFSAIRDPHSIVAYEDGFLVNSTGTNELIHAKWEGEKLAETVFWRYERAGGDISHVSSLQLYEGDVYVSLFGPRASSGWADARGGQVVNVSSGEVVAEGQRHPHSLAAVDGRLYWLESGRSRLHSYAPQSGPREELALHGYLRGLRASGRALLIGASGARRRSKSMGTKNARPVDGRDLHSWLFRVHLRSGAVERRQLTPFCAEIYDILDLPRQVGPTEEEAIAAKVHRLWRLEDQALEEQEGLLARLKRATQRVGHLDARLAERASQYARAVDFISRASDGLDNLLDDGDFEERDQRAWQRPVPGAEICYDTCCARLLPKSAIKQSAKLPAAGAGSLFFLRVEAYLEDSDDGLLRLQAVWLPAGGWEAKDADGNSLAVVDSEVLPVSRDWAVHAKLTTRPAQAERLVISLVNDGTGVIRITRASCLLLDGGAASPPVSLELEGGV